MADHSTDRTAPDYELDDGQALDADQMRTLFEPTRIAIVELLGERAATTSELAEALGKPKGTVGHHCKALEAAGLIRVVRTKRVRAMEAKYYGRTARTFILDHIEELGFTSDGMLTEAANEMERFRRSSPEDALPGITSLRYARIPIERAADWEKRLDLLITEFTKEPRSGERVYGMAIALFPTTKPVLPDGTP